MTLSEDLSWRNLVKDKTFADLSWLDEPKTFYLGTDCSSPSLTIGNLAILLLAKRLMKAGWKSVLLIGGATSLIGDPGGKDEERQLASKETIETNVLSIKQQVAGLFEGMEFISANNYDWFDGVGYLEFLREVGKNYSMSELLQRDFIQSRLGDGANGISYAEFSYSLIQGYDYWQLYKLHQVVMQIGGSDQWGNMLSGVPLIRKKENVEVQAMSMPLVINKLTGKKFGKSEEGAVWLDPNLTSPTKFYQFWINVDDEGLDDYLKVYTELPREEIERVISEHKKAPQERQAQRILAREITNLVHGKANTELAELITDFLIGKKNVADIAGHIDQVRKEIPSVRATVGGSIIEAMVGSNLATSNTDAKRFINENAVSINGTRVTRETFEASDFVGNVLLMRRGKAFKDTVLVELVS